MRSFLEVCGVFLETGRVVLEMCGAFLRMIRVVVSATSYANLKLAVFSWKLVAFPCNLGGGFLEIGAVSSKLVAFSLKLVVCF